MAQACDKSAYRDVLKMVSDTSEVKLRIRERYVVQVRERAKLNLVLGDKMNLTVRLGKLFNESSTGVPALLPCSQLPRQARGTSQEIVYLTSLSGSFCHLVGTESGHGLG